MKTNKLATIFKTLPSSSKTGRIMVKSERTRKVYFVEPMDKNGKPANWGDINPATKFVEGSYGKKYKGCIHPDESIITEENGFKNIQILDIGESPFSAIERLDSQYPSI